MAYLITKGIHVRFLPGILILSVSLFASPKEMNSFTSKFDQTITDSSGKTIRYEGELWASKPQNALWVYHKPVQKSVYITNKNVVVLEPAIEQATLRSLDNDIDFLQIVSKAKKIDEEHYTATVKGQSYSILLKNDLLASIGYTDGFDNKVQIRFLSPVQNRPIDSSRFKPMIPTGYDVLQDR